MSGSVIFRDEFMWNFVCIHDGEHVATIFFTELEPWRVILHSRKGSRVLENTRYPNPNDAMRSAENQLTFEKAHRLER